MLPKDEYEVIGLQELVLTEVPAGMPHASMYGVLETHKSEGCAIWEEFHYFVIQGQHTVILHLIDAGVKTKDS